MRHLLSLGIVLATFIAPAIGQTDPGLADPPAPEAASPDAEPAEELPPRADLRPINEMVRVGAYADAHVALVEIQKEFPADPRVLLMRGEVLLALDAAQEALPLLQLAAELDAELPRVHFQLATALNAAGQREAALEAFAQEIAANDDPAVHIMAHLNRATLQAQAEKWSEAAGSFEAVVALDPSRVEAYGDLAGMYLRADRLDEAGRTLDRGLDQGFRSARFEYVLGTRYYGRESYEPAIERLQQALSLDPTLAEAERTLASALDQLGREQEALAHLRRYLELKPDAPDSKQVAERIRSIEGS